MFLLCSSIVSLLPDVDGSVNTATFQKIHVSEAANLHEC